jgi:hypothetical protein
MIPLETSARIILAWWVGVDDLDVLKGEGT